MQEKRWNQRIRFASSPAIKIGFGGAIGEGGIENLSLSGLMIRTNLPLEIGRTAGCEFSLFGSPMIDVPVSIVSRIGDIFGGRFQTGPVSQILIEDAIHGALARGQASILAVNEIGGRKIMRLSGGLNGSLHNDFMHALTRVWVEEIDLADVTAVDEAGLALCQAAVNRFGVAIGAKSACFAAAWQNLLESSSQATTV